MYVYKRCKKIFQYSQLLIVDKSLSTSVCLCPNSAAWCNCRFKPVFKFHCLWLPMIDLFFRRRIYCIHCNAFSVVITWSFNKFQAKQVNWTRFNNPTTPNQNSKFRVQQERESHKLQMLYSIYMWALTLLIVMDRFNSQLNITVLSIHNFVLLYCL